MEAGLTGSPARALEFRQADPTEHAAIARLLAHAFANDPAIGWMVRTDEREAATAAFFAKVLSDEGFAFGEVTIDRALTACAVWLPAARPAHEATAEERAAEAAWVLGVAGPERLQRFIDFLRTEAAIHPAGRNFRHLNFLGVLPEHQGQGIGTRLLAHGLARLDRERMAGYVETVNPRNARWYERFGFRLERTVAVGEDGPTIHCLWREPERPA